MNGIGASIKCCIDDFSDVEIGILQSATAQGTSLVGHTTMQGIGIVVGKNRHRSNMQSVQGLDDAYRYFATVGNQYFIDFFTVHIAIMTPQIYKKKDNLYRLSFLFICFAVATAKSN